MSAAERYLRASSSTNLKMETEPKDVDLVIAAGLANHLGHLLLRCQKEFDATRRELAMAESATSRALVMMGLRSVTPAYLGLQRHASSRAMRRNMPLETDEIADVAGNALDVWLDQRCDTCSGTKETGIYGGPRAICVRCRGTGIRRRVFPSKTSAQLVLGEWLISEAERMVSEAMQESRKWRAAIDKRKHEIQDGLR
jgi:hypothetical protein